VNRDVPKHKDGHTNTMTHTHSLSSAHAQTHPYIHSTHTQNRLAREMALTYTGASVDGMGNEPDLAVIRKTTNGCNQRTTPLDTQPHEHSHRHILQGSKITQTHTSQNKHNRLSTPHTDRENARAHTRANVHETFKYIQSESQEISGSSFKLLCLHSS